jgi:hypothetical protein
MLKKIVGAIRWIEKHWAVSLALLLVVAIAGTSVVCWNLFGKEKKVMVPVYLTVSGLGEGKDMTQRELMVEDNTSVALIFSLEHPEIYEEFQQPLVMNNTFQSFLGVKPTSSKRFYVKVDGTYENNVTQAFIWEGAVVEIEYR